MKISKELKTRNLLLYLAVLILCFPILFINIRSSHDWGDDFAQYIHQAINIIRGIPQIETGYIYNPEAFNVGPPAYPIGFPLLLAPVCFLWGNNIHAFSIFLSVLLLLSFIVLFSFYRRSFSSLLSLLLILLFAYHPLTLNLKMEIMSEIPYLLFSLLTIVFYLNRQPNKMSQIIWISVLLGITMSIRIMGFALALAIATDCIIQTLKGKRVSGYSNSLLKPFLISVIALIVYIILNIVIFKVPYAGIVTYKSNFNFENAGVGELIQKKLTYNLQMLQYLFGINYSHRPSLSILLPAAAVIFIIIGFIQKCLRNTDVVDWMFLFYFLTLLIYPNFTSGLRFLFPLFPFMLYYAVLGTQSIQLNRAVNKNLMMFIFTFILALWYFPGISKSINETPQILRGPQDNASLVAFDYIRASTPANSIFLFVKPRALSLYTGRKGLCNDLHQSQKAFIAKMESERVNYFMTYDDMPNEALDTFLKNNKNSVTLLWENEKFHIYSLPLSYKYYSINEIMNSIRSNSDWLKLVTQKALQKNISLDSMIHCDAIWVYDEGIRKK